MIIKKYISGVTFFSNTFFYIFFLINPKNKNISLPIILLTLIFKK